MFAAILPFFLRNTFLRHTIWEEWNRMKCRTFTFSSWISTCVCVRPRMNIEKSVLRLRSRNCFFPSLASRCPDTSPSANRPGAAQPATRAIENLSLRLAQPLSASGYHFLIRWLPANFFSVGSAQRMKRQRASLPLSSRRRVKGVGSKNKNLNQSGFGYHVGCPTNGLHTQGRKETCI